MTDNTIEQTNDNIAVMQVVKDTLKNCQPDVIANVQQHYIEQEITKRSTLLIAAFDKLKTLRDAVSRIKPDQKSLDGNGVVVNETYSTQKYKELTDAKAKLVKFEKAVDKAINDADYNGISK